MPRKLTQEQVLEKIKETHGNKYDYSKIIYSGTKNKVDVICPIHGDFFITPDHLFRGIGCPYCGKTAKSNTEEFIKKAEKIHGNKYDYSLSNYINNKKKIEIICNKCGKHFFQTPVDHLQGKGCPYCSFSKGETLINNFLEKNNILFEAQKRFKDCRDKRELPFDFYLPDENLVIEFQGIQHYKNKGFGGDKETAEKDFILTKKHDQIKRDYCRNNNIKEIEISYKDFSNIEKILTESIFCKLIARNKDAKKINSR
jgi:DNA-directed RNA polymerase subunit RPC12/RpoP